MNQIYVLVHWAFLLVWQVPQSLLLKNSPTAWGCYQHTLLVGWYSAGDDQSWFPSNMMLRIEVHQTRASSFSQSEGPLCAFLQLPSVSSLRRGLSLAIKPRSVECCSDDCPSEGFSHLHVWSWSGSWSPHYPKHFSISFSVWPWGHVSDMIYEFVSSSEQIWRHLAWHHLFTSGSSAVNGCRQNESPNTTPLQSINYSLVKQKIRCL